MERGDLVEMFRHWNAGRSQVQIYQALNIDRKTIRKYLAPALAEGLQPSPDEVFDEELWRARIGRWFPELVDPAARAVTWPQIAAHHQWITDQLKVPVTVATIAQRLRDDYLVPRCPNRRYVVTSQPHSPNNASKARSPCRVARSRRAAKPRSITASLGLWCDPVSGRRVAVWVFAMILSCSRAMFVQPVLRMDQTSWNASHVAAFEFFGGVPARLVCDNLRTGVTRPDLYDPQINLAYGELAAFYGTLIDPARARKPKDKPRIERPDALHSRLVLRRPRIQFPGPDAGRGACGGRPRCMDVHKHRGLDGQTPGSVFSRGRTQCADSVAAATVRVGGVLGGAGGSGLPRQVGQGVVLGAVAADRPAGHRAHRW